MKCSNCGENDCYRTYTICRECRNAEYRKQRKERAGKRCECGEPLTRTDYKRCARCKAKFSPSKRNLQQRTSMWIRPEKQCVLCTRTATIHGLCEGCDAKYRNAREEKGEGAEEIRKAAISMTRLVYESHGL